MPALPAATPGTPHLLADTELGKAPVPPAPAPAAGGGQQQQQQQPGGGGRMAEFGKGMTEARPSMGPEAGPVGGEAAGGGLGELAMEIPK
jgi:hypothetical protein